jgi:hypothetical protein
LNSTMMVTSTTPIRAFTFCDLIGMPRMGFSTPSSRRGCGDAALKCHRVPRIRQRQALIDPLNALAALRFTASRAARGRASVS